MKTFAKYIGILGLGGALFSACDYVDLPVPTTENKPALSATLALDSAEAAYDSIHGPVAPVQKVLLEDYTGHTCGNCPDAAVVAHSQKEIHGERLVVMSVHAGYFAKILAGAPGEKYTYNFSTPVGEEWMKDFGIAANPNGMVNRVPYTGTTYYQGIATWPAAITAELAKAPRAALTVTSLYKPSTRTVNIKVRTKYLSNLNGKYNLAVFVTEDSIINWQKNYKANPIDIQNYVHPHALRAAADGAYGRLNAENPAKENETEKYFAVNLNADWKAEKCSVVAFIFDADTKQVVQVEEVHIK